MQCNWAVTANSEQPARVTPPSRDTIASNVFVVTTVLFFQISQVRLRLCCVHGRIVRMTHTLFPAQQCSLTRPTGFVFKSLGKPLGYSGPFECRVRSGVLLCMEERTGAARYRAWLECLTKVYRDFNQQKVVATADGSADNILKCPSLLALMRCVTDDISCGLTSFSLSW